MKLSSDAQRTVIPVLIAAIVALSTGWLTTAEYVTPGATGAIQYGFPLTWRADLQYGCPPWCQPNQLTFNPWAFLADLCFYLATVFAIGTYARPLVRKLKPSPLSWVRRVVRSWRNHSGEFSVLTVVSLLALAGVESILLASASTTSSCEPYCYGSGNIFVESFQASSPNNATAYITNFGSGRPVLQWYSISSSIGQVYSSPPSWQGPTVPANTSVRLSILTNGTSFIFDWGISYQLTIGLGRYQETLTLGQLGFDAGSPNMTSPTDLWLTFSNTGPRMVELRSYEVFGPQGQTYNNTAWSGPTLGPGARISSDVTMNGAFFTFQHGNSYKIYLYNMTVTEWTITASV